MSGGTLILTLFIYTFIKGQLLIWLPYTCLSVNCNLQNLCLQLFSKAKPYIPKNNTRTISFYDSITFPLVSISHYIIYCSCFRQLRRQRWRLSVRLVNINSPFHGQIICREQWSTVESLVKYRGSVTLLGSSGDYWTEEPLHLLILHLLPNNPRLLHLPFLYFGESTPPPPLRPRLVSERSYLKLIPKPSETKEYKLIYFN